MHCIQFVPRPAPNITSHRINPNWNRPEIKIPFREEYFIKYDDNPFKTIPWLWNGNLFWILVQKQTNQTKFHSFLAEVNPHVRSITSLLRINNLVSGYMWSSEESCIRNQHTCCCRWPCHRFLVHDHRICISNSDWMSRTGSQRPSCLYRMLQKQKWSKLKRLLRVISLNCHSKLVNTTSTKTCLTGKATTYDTWKRWDSKWVRHNIQAHNHFLSRIIETSRLHNPLLHSWSSS